MISLNKNDLVCALKKFKSIAKQDILSSSLTPNPNFWREHAEARRKEYLDLIEKIEVDGVDETYLYALKVYESLPSDSQNPKLKGREQAIEVFFQVIGIKPEQLKESKEKHKSFQEILMENNAMTSLHPHNV